jgi:hypothetical protein
MGGVQAFGSFVLAFSTLIVRFVKQPGTVLGLLSLVATGATFFRSPTAGAVLLAGSMVIFGAVPLYGYVVEEQRAGPFQFLEQTATWTIKTSDGRQSEMSKRTKLKALQRDVYTIPHTLSPDGTIADVRGSPGRVFLNTKVGQHQYLYVHLFDPPLQPQQELDVSFDVDLVDAFVGNPENVAVTVSRLTKKLTMVVVLPMDRPITRAWLTHNNQRKTDIPVAVQNGCQELRYAPTVVKLNDTYEIGWEW